MEEWKPRDEGEALALRILALELLTTSLVDMVDTLFVRWRGGPPMEVHKTALSVSEEALGLNDNRPQDAWVLARLRYLLRLDTASGD